MRFASQVLTVVCIAVAISGCKESREEKVDHLFPADRRVQSATEQFYKVAAVSYPHVPSDKAKAVIAKYFKENEPTNRALVQKQWSEEYWSDAELETAARMIHDPADLIAIAGGADNARKISIKIYETQQKALTQDVKEKMSKTLNELTNQLREMEARAGE